MLLSADNRNAASEKSPNGHATDKCRVAGRHDIAPLGLARNETDTLIFGQKQARQL